VDEVTNALGSDSRIGPKYLKGGLGFGGPCFPRDNIAMQRFAALQGLKLRLSPSVTTANNDVVERIFGLIKSRVQAPGPLALLGISYKPGTHIVEESQSLSLARRLREAGYEVRLHDPAAISLSRSELLGLGELCDDPYSAAQNARAVLLLTDWPQYATLDWTRLERHVGAEPLLFDSWRICKDMKFDRFTHLALGLAI